MKRPNSNPMAVAFSVGVWTVLLLLLGYRAYRQTLETTDLPKIKSLNEVIYGNP